MFEIHDERIGHLKIFNVTEARANFADVLKESDAKVVVTRHGRPTKILITYDEYLSLLAASGRSVPENLADSKLAEETSIADSITGAQAGSETKKSPAAVPPKWVQREADQIVNSLRGLLSK